MKIKKGFTMRCIAGSNIVVPVGSTSREFNGMITLNDSALFFWECLKNDTSIDEMVEKILREYDADEDVVRADVEAFVDKLRQNNILDE